MTYLVKEIYCTLQGERAHAKCSVVLCRFSYSNLWMGREKDRWRATCQFCDTDFVGTNGPGWCRFAITADLAAAVGAAWQAEAHARAKSYVVCTGGEPLRQLDEQAVEALRAVGFEVGVETTALVTRQWVWTGCCVSPKAGTHVRLTCGDELKLVYPPQEALLWLRRFGFSTVAAANGWLEREKRTRMAVEYCLAYPHWWQSMQTDKYLGIA